MSRFSLEEEGILNHLWIIYYLQNIKRCVCIYSKKSYFAKKLTFPLKTSKKSCFMLHGTLKAHNIGRLPLILKKRSFLPPHQLKNSNVCNQSYGLHFSKSHLEFLLIRGKWIKNNKLAPCCSNIGEKVQFLGGSCTNCAFLKTNLSNRLASKESWGVKCTK